MEEWFIIKWKSLYKRNKGEAIFIIEEYIEIILMLVFVPKREVAQLAQLAQKKYQTRERNALSSL